MTIWDADELLAKAEEIARREHAGQVDKNGEPYVGHLGRVAARLRDPGDRAVAWLHDVVEDCGLTRDDLLAEGIPAHIVDAVLTLTRREGESYAEFIDRIAHKAHMAALGLDAGVDRPRRVKIADLCDNLDPDRGDHPGLRRRYLKALDRLLHEREAPAEGGA